MMAVPERAEPDASTLNDTTPGPVPEAGDTVIQPTALAAVHGQFAAVFTVIEPPPPAAPSDAEAGAIVTLQPGDCVTLNR